jgi:hypothetical protein
MRDIKTVLEEKQSQIKRLQVEIETLSAAAALLADEHDKPVANGRWSPSVQESPRVAVGAGTVKQFP